MKKETYFDLGEEAGREEAADDFPFLPKLSTCSEERLKRYHRFLLMIGHVRARKDYGLSGRAAKAFAQCFSLGYQANCRLYEDDLLLTGETE